MTAEPTSPRVGRQSRWALAAALVLLCGGAIALVLWPREPGKAKSASLEGKLYAFVRPPTARVQSLPIEEKGALPARPGGIMSLQVQLEEPALTYFVWLNAEGQALPLYPWNTTKLEVGDIHEPPPLRRAAKLVDSPLLGGGWTFGKQRGMETVLLLARRTPLPETTKLAALLEPLPTPAKVRDSEELLMLGWDPEKKAVTTLLSKNLGEESEAQEADAPLRALVARLGEHFEFIRAVRFANVGE